MKTDIDFYSQGTRCAAWFYDPGLATPSPCVVMAHGFSAVREQRFDAYAERFVQAGLAVFLFDYRHFGSSAGEPRQFLTIARQLQDWEAAVATTRKLPKVDPTRIALFGSSFSGGHVQTIAARDNTIASVVAQVPWCEGLPNLLPTLGIGTLVRLGMAGMRDIGQTLLGREPYRVPAVGKPGSVAFMVSPDAVPGFDNMNPPNSNWRNAVSARVALTAGGYRPGLSAAKIQCPILYIIGEKDAITMARFAHDAAKRAPRAEVKSYNCGHFDVYVPPLWDDVVAVETEFLLRHLKPGENKA